MSFDPELIGEVIEIKPTLSSGQGSITYRNRGSEKIDGLGDMEIPSGDHYTDRHSTYEEVVSSLVDGIRDKEVRVLDDDGSESVLQTFEDAKEICRQVDEEYEATVTQRLQRINPEHEVPALDPKLVWPGYIALRAGGAVVLPTSVGNIVGSASPRGLSTMFAVKERPPEKAGVVLTTMDEITKLAKVPEGWDGYLEHMHREGVLVGSKLERNEEHPLFERQPDWSRENSMQEDGTSMFVFLPGPYSDVTARMLARDGLLLTASSANKSGQGNNRDMNQLHTDIKRGCDFVAWDPEAVGAYPLDEENESQGVMVDFRPDEEGSPRFHIIRFGFMNGPFITESVSWIRKNIQEPVELTGDVINVAHLANKK